MSDVDDLDPVIHAVARLRIMSILTALGPHDTVAFTRLQAELDLTAGNLVTHLRKLEDAGYVTTQKQGGGRSALTTVAVTDVGRAAFARYTAALRAMLDLT